MCHGAPTEGHGSHCYIRALLTPGLPIWQQEGMDTLERERRDLSQGRHESLTGWQEATWLHGGGVGGGGGVSRCS